jgi:hypothetical protein
MAATRTLSSSKSGLIEATPPEAVSQEQRNSKSGPNVGCAYPYGAASACALGIRVVTLRDLNVWSKAINPGSEN